MMTTAYSRWPSRVVTFTLSALVAVSAVYWGLKGWRTAAPAALPVAPASAPLLNPQAVARALGGGQAVATGAPAVGNRYMLVGVVADRSQDGAALISIDGKAAKPFRVGASVDGRLLLQSVARRRAALATDLNAPAEVTLELPIPGR